MLTLMVAEVGKLAGAGDRQRP